MVKHGIQGGGNLMETAPESANHDSFVMDMLFHDVNISLYSSFIQRCKLYT